MSLLITIWVFALALVIAIMVFASSRARRCEVTLESGVTPTQFTEFFGDQFHDMLVHAVKGFHHVKPHATQMGMSAFAFSKRGHDLFVERVFGRMELKRGNTVSFFLKHIAEERRGIERDYRDPTLRH